jgi:hypothetical protein
MHGKCDVVIVPGRGEARVDTDPNSHIRNRWPHLGIKASLCGPARHHSGGRLFEGREH